MSFDRSARLKWMHEEAKKRILLLDGSWGVMIQGYKLGEDDFRGTRFGNHASDLKGNNDLLTLTKPEIIREIGHDYLKAGADFIETNTFNSISMSQADYGLEHLVSELNESGARLAREVCDSHSTSSRPRLVAGVLDDLGVTGTCALSVCLIDDDRIRALEREVDGVADRRGGDREHHDHRCDADDNAQGREACAQLVGPKSARGLLKIEQEQIPL